MSGADVAQWLPWSEEAEQSLLGSLLQDNEALPAVAGLVDGRSFWAPQHRVVFDAIQRLVVAGKPADVVTVFDALQCVGRAEEVGGIAYLEALTNTVPSARHAKRYAELVADKATRRALLVAADGVAELVHKASTADEALDGVHALLASVKRVKAGQDPKPVADLFGPRIDHWQALAAGDITPGTPTGLAPIDVALGGGLKPGRVVVLAARPNVGKTSLASQVLLHVGGLGKPVLMLSQEMTAGELIDRATAHLGRVRLDRITTGRLADDEWNQVAEAAERAAPLPIFVDDQPALTLLDIRAKARHVQRRAGGLALVVVDYIQLCTSMGKAEKRHHQIEEISRGMKTLAKELNVCVLLLSQLNRSGEGGEPDLHHLKESGSIEEDADAVVMLHPMGNEPDGRLLVLAKIAKNRHGQRGRLALSFDGSTQTWVPSQGDVSARRNAGAA